MKKERAKALEQKFNRTGEGRPTRTTIFLSERWQFLLDCYAIESGRPKGEVVREAIQKYLTSKGYADPSRITSALAQLKR